MRNISIIMLIAALILGTLTVYFARSIVNNQARTQQASETIGDELKKTTMVVAVVPMKFGDEITVEKLKEVPWPADVPQEGSFETIPSLIGNERRVVLRSIGRNEPVTKEKISGFGSRASLSQIIEPGFRAAAVRVNDVVSAGGFVLPGDKVDIIHTYTPSGGTPDPITNIIIENLRVLAIDQISDEDQSGAFVAKSVTLEVTPEHVQKLALAETVGELSLALRRFSNADGDVQVAGSKTIYVKDLTPASEMITEQKVAPKRIFRRTASKAAAKPNPWGDMKVTRGVKSTEEKVVREEITNKGELAGGAISATTQSTTNYGGSPQK